MTPPRTALLSSQESLSPWALGCRDDPGTLGGRKCFNSPDRFQRVIFIFCFCAFLLGLPSCLGWSKLVSSHQGGGPGPSHLVAPTAPGPPPVSSLLSQAVESSKIPSDGKVSAAENHMTAFREEAGSRVPVTLRGCPRDPAWPAPAQWLTHCQGSVLRGSGK